ncbi:DUF1566 domain-containing protein [Desulfobacterales bacterium HSG17]|nr:DUF1566 domain-containing protein [Desulfobacterales bacterium HSG17]
MEKQTKSAAISFIFVLILSFNAFAWPIPDTGQTKCYDDEGNEIDPCPQPGEPFYGQDGNYNINPPSYTKLDAGGNDLPDSAEEWVMVRDNVTGLMWEVKQNKDDIQDYSNPHDADNTYTWYDSSLSGETAGTPGDGTDTEDFINHVNTKNLGGYSDWRLPTNKENSSILRYLPHRINTDYFPNTQSGFYTDYSSSTTYTSITIYAWFVNFYNGHEYYGYKSKSTYVRAVRGGQSHLLDHLVINNDETVTDTATGLMWQRSESDAVRTWKNALEYCKNMSKNGYNDWRLPTLKELLSIAEIPFINSMAIDERYFPNTLSYYCFKYWWSSTTSILDIEDNAWCVTFCDSSIGYASKVTTRRVYAIRGGQYKLFGHLIISIPQQASSWNINSIMPITWDTANINGVVKISISYEGGRPETYETISESTSNDGYYEWTIPNIPSFNCMLKIEPLSDPTKGTVQGLFTIGSYIKTSSPDLVLTEPTTPDAGEPRTFNIMLASKPSGSVTLNLYSSNPGEFEVSPASVTLNSENWETGVTVTVTPEYDGIVDGDQRCSVLASTGSEGGFTANELSIIQITVRNADTGVTVNSIYPSFGESDKELLVTITGTGFTDATKVSIYPEGGTEVSLTPDTVTSTTITLTIPGQSPGNYNLKAGSFELTNALTFANTAAVTTQNRKKAIIVTGSGPYYDNNLWDSTEKCAKRAYLSLFFQGYSDETIQFLSKKAFMDITKNGSNDVDAPADLQNLESAIKTWAADATDELILYMIGPGTNASFQFNNSSTPEMLTASTLESWLATLQTTMTGKIIIIYDAPMSHTFLAPLSASNRIVITGTSENEYSWFLDDGEISFSWFFWNSIFDNAKIYEAFTFSKNMMNTLQTPQMTENGSPVNRKKREITEEITVGRGRDVLTNPPEIGEVCPEQTITDTETADLWAKSINADNSISRVWARLAIPLGKFKPNNEPIIIAPTLKLLDPENDGQYDAAYKEFKQNGEYGIFIYARDKKDLQSLPKPTKVTQNSGILPVGGDMNIDGSVDLKDAITALQIAAGMDIIAVAEFEVSGDEKVGVEDAVFILGMIAGLK